MAHVCDEATMVKLKEKNFHSTNVPKENERSRSPHLIYMIEEESDAATGGLIDSYQKQ
jgi:hypothetical protein